MSTSGSTIITLKADADPAAVQRELAARGLWVRRHDLVEAPAADAAGPRVQFAVEAHSRDVDGATLLGIGGVAAVAREPRAHPRVDEQPRIINVGNAGNAGNIGNIGNAGTVGGTAIGLGAPPALIAGPCSVESEAQIGEIAAGLARHGVRFLRGGAFKPRTSPYAFQGHGARAL